MNDLQAIESIIVRINHLGLCMGVVEGSLVLEGKLSLLSPSERAIVSRLKPDLIAYLTTPREHVAIMCRQRQADGRACGPIVTVQRPTGKVAWCQTCYGEEAVPPRIASGDAATPEPCYGCRSTDWWISVQGNRICRVCHPPAYPELEDREATAAALLPAPTPAPEPDTEPDHVVPDAPHVVLPLRRPSRAKKARALAMYVARDLSYWITDEPHVWADKVTIRGKEFNRLTPSHVAWLKNTVIAAEGALETGKVSMAELCRIVDAFCPVYEFAVNAGMVPDVAEQATAEPRVSA